MSFVQPCPYCGKVHIGSACEEQVAEYKRIEAFRKLLAQSPRTPVTYGLIAINVILFLLLTASCINLNLPILQALQVALFSPPTSALLNFGADFGPFTLVDQPWRLVTAMFIHIGLIHIGCNMYALYMVGPFCEKVFGNLGMLTVYFVSGIVGGVVSLWLNPLAPSAGASGAIFGLFGAIFGVLLAGRKLLPSELSRKMLPQMGWILAINLFLGFSIPGIDNAAHIGGLLFGAVAGAIGGYTLRWPTTSRFISLLAVSLLAVAICSGVYWYMSKTSVAVYIRYSRDVSNEFDVRYEAYEHGQLSKDAFVRELEDSILPRWKNVGMLLRNDHSASLGLNAETASGWQEYHDAREASWRHLLNFFHTNDQRESIASESAHNHAEMLYNQNIVGE